MQPVFDAIGRETLWLGPAGNGSRLKLALNNWLAVLVEGMAETIALTEALGWTRTCSSRPSPAARSPRPTRWPRARAMVDGDFAPGFPLRHAFKDIGLALDAAHARRPGAPAHRGARAALAARRSPGHADEDVAAVISVASPPAGAA